MSKAIAPLTGSLSKGDCSNTAMVRRACPELAAGLTTSGSQGTSDLAEECSDWKSLLLYAIICVISQLRIAVFEDTDTLLV
jgi:hypothetical protein